MGMSASQARYLSLIARQSNLEYQGQQINQERTILSQQCTALYNSLLTMEVPTPPSTSEFTTIEYSGSNGAITYSFAANDVKPGSDGLYNVTLGYIDHGHSLAKNNGYKTTRRGSETINVTQVTTTTSEIATGYKLAGTETPEGYMVAQVTKPATGEYYIEISNGKYVKGGNEDENYAGGYYVYQVDEPQDNTGIGVKGFSEPAGSVIFSSTDLNGIYTKDGKLCSTVPGAVKDLGDGKYELIDTYGPYFREDSNSPTTLTVENNTGYTIAGKTAHSLDQAGFTQDQLDGYITAIENSGLKKTDGQPYTKEDFYVYFDDDNQPHFALKAEVEKAAAGVDNACVTYDYISNGEYTKNISYDKSKLTFDPSSGRIVSIDIPSTYDAEGNPLSYITIDLKATKVTDDAAYKDAYAQFEYKQYEYDKAQQEINAKTEIIQQQDRNLELKLQRLDNERTMITTEIEALDKVINDNIEASYKTFSG